MVYVDTTALDRKSFDDDSLIKFYGIAIGGTDNWGDEDCEKPVTDVYSCDITIDASVKNKFIGENGKYMPISFVRYGYYRPAYHIMPNTGYNVVENDDGSITYQMRMSK